jgi:ABC-type uncharacterized transport system permease subunit
MKKLANLFPHADKVLHFIAGALIAVLVLLVTNEPWFGFAGAFIAGLYKEFTDHLKQESISKSYGINTWLDWFATMAGGVVVELLWF